MKYSRLLLQLAICALCVSQLPASELTRQFAKDVKPLLTKYCFSCHDVKDNDSGINLVELDPDLVGGDDAETWQDALDQLSAGEMPPEDAAQPSPNERQLISRWLVDALREALSAKRYRNGRVVTRRLTRYEYANTMRDLLGVELDYASDLPPEPASPDGFLNNGLTLEMSPTQVELYLKTARRAMREAVVTGDRPRLYEFRQTETAVGRFPTRKFAGHEPVRPEFVLDLNEFPRHGEFELLVTAQAATPDNQPLPRMRISMGHTPGIIHVPRKLIGEVDVTEQTQTYRFRGRMEEFPQPGPIAFGNSGFKGLIVMVDFLDADGNELRHDDRQYAQQKPQPKGKAAKVKAAKAKAAKAKAAKAKAAKAKAAQAKAANADPQRLPPLEELPGERFGHRLDIRITRMEFRAPIFASWPPPSHQRLMTTEDADASDEYERAGQLLRQFMRRAFRRPVSAEEVDATLKLFTAVREHSGTFEEAMRETFASVLVSPHFLYRVEIRNADGEPQPLNEFELASRLSYFLWSTMPDAMLFELAKEGKLRDPSVLKAQTLRMLDDQRSKEFTRRFVDQWLDLDALDRVAVNPEFFPEFDNRLKDQMRLETRGYFDEILRGDRSGLELIESNWTMLNRPLAKHYGIDGPRSSDFVRVEVDRRRGGLLGQGAFLLSNANGEDSHPIKRAVWILDRLLDDPPAPPPPDVPELDPESPDLAKLTLKQQLAAHRQKESCASCHRGIDPWGVPLENFDAVGRWREQVPAHKKRPATPVDLVSELPDGTKLDGHIALRRHLVNNYRDAFARSLVKHVMAYGLGRSLDFGDREAIEQLTRQFVKNDLRLRPLIVDFVGSETFLVK